MRARETRKLATDGVEADDDRESTEFAAYTAALGRAVKRLKRATQREIRLYLEARGVEWYARWSLDAFESLRQLGEIRIDERIPGRTFYEWGAKEKRVVPVNEMRMGIVFTPNQKRADWGI